MGTGLPAGMLSGAWGVYQEMTGLDNTYDPLAWGSHLPALLAAVGASEGPVLELGVGHFSTPALHALCGAMNRMLASVETDEKWMAEFKPTYKNKWHGFATFIPPVHNWGCVFIDDSPGGERRAHSFKMLIQHAEFVVVHDYHLENEEHIHPMLEGVNYHVTKTYQPPTLIASRFKEIPQAILCL